MQCSACFQRTRGPGFKHVVSNCRHCLCYDYTFTYPYFAVCNSLNNVHSPSLTTKMRCVFLFLNWHSIGFISAAVASGDWGQDLDAVLYTRSHRKLLFPRTPTGPDSPKYPKPPPLLTVPENKHQDGSKRQHPSPQPSRGRLSDSARHPSPYSNERPLSFESIARDANRQDRILAAARNSRSVDQRRAKKAQSSSLEAHALVSGVGYAFSSSKHKHGGLSSQFTVEDVQRPVMQSAKGRDWVKVGGVTRSAESKATAVAMGYKVTGKLGRAEQSKGSGSIEFRAGNSFRQIYKVGPGEKLERTLNAGDVLDSKNNKFETITVTTHLTDEGSCLVGACRAEQLGAAHQKGMGKDKQA